MINVSLLLWKLLWRFNHMNVSCFYQIFSIHWSNQSNEIFIYVLNYLSLLPLVHRHFNRHLSNVEVTYDTFIELHLKNFLSIFGHLPSDDIYEEFLQVHFKNSKLSLMLLCYAIRKISLIQWNISVYMRIETSRVEGYLRVHGEACVNGANYGVSVWT